MRAGDAGREVVLSETPGVGLPGDWPNERLAHRTVREVVSQANAFCLAQRALLQLEIGRITIRDDPRHLNLSGIESWKFPGDWEEEGEADVIFVNRFGRGGHARAHQEPLLRGDRGGLRHSVEKELERLTAAIVCRPETG